MDINDYSESEEENPVYDSHLSVQLVESRPGTVRPGTVRTPFRPNQAGHNSIESENAAASLPGQSMANEDWTNLAFSLGMPAADSQKSNFDARRFAERVKKKDNISRKQVLDYLGTLMASLRKDHPLIRHKKATEFRRDAMLDQKAKSSKPGLVFGYRGRAFTEHLLEVQNGTISTPGQKPQSLERVSQIVPGVFWPFFVIESSDESMVAAQHACAAAAVTCNNALGVLTRAALTAEDHRANVSPVWSANKAAVVFSLSINGNIAYFNAHSMRDGQIQNFNTVKAYRLYDESDVECLLARIESILVWADFSRLPSIIELLNIYHRRITQPAQPPSTLTPPASQESSPKVDKHIISRKASEETTQRVVPVAPDASQQRSKSRLRRVLEIRLSTLSKPLSSARPPSPRTPEAMTPDVRAFQEVPWRGPAPYDTFGR